MPTYAFNIAPASRELDAQIQQKIDQKTKPLGSLGVLEKLALQIARIQKTLTPDAGQLHHYVFAGDHGVAQNNVSAFPQEVTRQMLENLLTGGAGINVFVRQHHALMHVVDAGVKGPRFGPHPQFIDARVAEGTEDFMQAPAMTEDQWRSATLAGVELIQTSVQFGQTRCFSFGELGISNTTSAAALMAGVLGLSAEECAGAGTGASSEILDNKVTAIQIALETHQHALTTGAAIMQHLGGLELAMMAGAMAEAARLGRVVLVDGFLATAALLCVWKDEPQILDYCVFGHCSNEQGHKKMLQALEAEPLLSLGLRLGEGTGAVAAWPLIQSAVNFLNEMASFDSAGVHSGS